MPTPIPDVSICMLTYFHEKYIRQAIESVLSQKTHYTYELVISDDCSQDGTREIIQEYRDKYPDRIRLNLNEENQGIPQNMFIARSMCRGRYLVHLSGDDYWINDDKLETQIRFLDDHPEYVGAACRIELRMDDSKIAYGLVPADDSRVNVPFTIRDYEKCIPLAMHGLLMRNYFTSEEGREYFAQARSISKYVDDAVDEVLLLRRGPVFVMDLVSDAHRVVNVSTDNNNYNSRYSRVDKFRHHIELINNMNSRWGDEIDYTEWYAEHTATGIVGMLSSLRFKEYAQVFAEIPKDYRRPFYRSVYVRSIPCIVNMIKNRLSRRK